MKGRPKLSGILSDDRPAAVRRLSAACPAAFTGQVSRIFSVLTRILGKKFGDFWKLFRSVPSGPHPRILFPFSKIKDTVGRVIRCITLCTCRQRSYWFRPVIYNSVDMFEFQAKSLGR